MPDERAAFDGPNEQANKVGISLRIPMRPGPEISPLDSEFQSGRHVVANLPRRLRRWTKAGALFLAPLTWDLKPVTSKPLAKARAARQNYPVAGAKVLVLLLT